MNLFRLVKISQYNRMHFQMTISLSLCKFSTLHLLLKYVIKMNDTVPVLLKESNNMPWYLLGIVNLFALSDITEYNHFHFE